MAQVVYYGCLDKKMIYDIDPLIDHIHTDIFNTADLRDTGILACPAFKDHIKNTFIVKSPYSYVIEWTGDDIKSPVYNQNFFDNNVKPRSIKDGFFSFDTPMPVFVAENDSLLMSTGPAYLHDNDITNLCYTIPGSFDIGKHIPRKLELPLKLKKPGKIKIGEGDALYYVKFHTNENIIFKKFIFTSDLKDLTVSYLSIRPFTQNYKSLEWWYKLVSRHNLKNYFIKKIKENLL